METCRKLPLYIESKDITVIFTKLSDREWYETHRAFAPIFEDWELLMSLDYYVYSEYDFDLPRIYTSLYTLFGPSNAYDDYKCSFAYDFRLLVEKQGQAYPYALSLADIKGGMPYFTYYRAPLPGKEANAYQRPVEAEFSQEEMRSCTIAFINFLRLFQEAYTRYFHRNFFRVNPSAYLIYGFKEGAFFSKHYPYDSENDWEQFQYAVRSFRADSTYDDPMSSDREVRVE